MAKSADEPFRMAPMIQVRGKGGVVPPGHRLKAKSMAQQEREAARRKMLLVSAVAVAVLAAGVLIGRFLPH